MSEVDELLAVERGEGTLFAARTAGEIVAEEESQERCLEIAEVEVCSRGEGRERVRVGTGSLR